jgi:hypothetical protein
VRKKELKKKKDPGKKKAFAFFLIETIPSFSSLFSFYLIIEGKLNVKKRKEFFTLSF